MNEEIQVWRVSYDGVSYVTNNQSEAEEAEKEDGCEICLEKMSREVYKSLPEFEGF